MITMIMKIKVYDSRIDYFDDRLDYKKHPDFTLVAGMGSSPKTNIRVSIKPLKTNMWHCDGVVPKSTTISRLPVLSKCKATRISPLSPIFFIAGWVSPKKRRGIPGGLKWGVERRFCYHSTLSTWTYLIIKTNQIASNPSMIKNWIITMPLIVSMDLKWNKVKNVVH